jgi:hypothetical protein
MYKTVYSNEQRTQNIIKYKCALFIYLFYLLYLYIYIYWHDSKKN